MGLMMYTHALDALTKVGLTATVHPYDGAFARIDIAGMNGTVTKRPKLSVLAIWDGGVMAWMIEREDVAIAVRRLLLPDEGAPSRA